MQEACKCMMEGITILVSPQWTSMITNQGILVERACLILHALVNSKEKTVHYQCSHKP